MSLIFFIYLFYNFFFLVLVFLEPGPHNPLITELCLIGIFLLLQVTTVVNFNFIDFQILLLKLNTKIFY